MFTTQRRLYEDILIKLPGKNGKDKKPLGVEAAITGLWVDIVGSSRDFGDERARREIERLFSRDARGDYSNALLCVSHFPGKGWQSDVAALLGVVSAVGGLIPAGAVKSLVQAANDPASKTAKDAVAKQTQKSASEKTRQVAAKLLGEENMSVWDDAVGAAKKGKDAYDTGKKVYDQVAGGGGQKGLSPSLDGTMPPPVVPWYRKPMLAAAAGGAVGALLGWGIKALFGRRGRK